MELKLNPNGKVAFMLKSGKDLVNGEMLEAEAKALIKNGSVKREKNKIIVDDKFIFTEDAEDEPIAEAVKKEPKEEKKDMPLKEAVKKPIKKKMADNADKKPLSSKPLARKPKRK